ncbi:transglycosylase domain-containing protein [Flavobacterium rhizosphaerae]|uniref:Biosynthetic peptidoglycan transglycosylase n=1 Tax=Flavobacterium rhizosphaerae TaxID=3163298 RepID=A0ABW8YYH4_9FLAO
MQKSRIKKISIRILIIITVLIALGFAGFFAFRNMALEKAIAKVSDKMQRDYNSTFTVASARFSGFSDIEMHGISVVPKNADTLISVKELKTSINLSKILVGDVQLGTLLMKDGYIQLINNKKGWNFRRFIKNNNPEKTVEDTEDKKSGYAERAYRLLNRALNLIPTDMELENLELRVNDKGQALNLNLRQMKLANNELQSDITVKQDSLSQNWTVEGFADPRNIKADLEFHSADTSRIMVPYINKRFNLKSGFDAIRLNVTNVAMQGGELYADGAASIKNFMVNHPKIAKKDVVIDSARFEYHMLFGDDFIRLDSTSVIQLNKIRFIPYAQYSITNDTIYAMKAHIPKMRAQDFIVSLPRGLFTNFEGMVAEGNFSYDLDFLYNKSNPDGLVFESSLTKEGLKVIKYGEANLSKLNTAFTYRAIDNDRLQRPVVVGPSNPYFTPLDEISPFLRNAVLTSEDPSFFRHMGFIPEAFRQSIIKNIKTKRFARGASTISMQLVKNVFLTREKTLSRKLEEILLVYILENNRIASKARMFEVYLNVIEWGPDVYGIGEASDFYFDKHPSQLSLDESVYLASIVPSPKKFAWRFNGQGQLKEYAVKHDNYIKDIMLRRGLITPVDTIAQNGQVYVSGRARTNMNIKEDTSFSKDSLDFDEFFFNLGNSTF